MTGFRSTVTKLPRAFGLAALAIALAGCGGSSALVKYCCYEGDAVLAHLSDVEMVKPGGGTLAFRDVYTDFQLQESLITTPLPIQRVDISRVIYHSLPPVLPLYDANKNGWLELPELTVMYVREGAIGLGFDVDHLEVNGKRADAITTSAADIGGLMKSINARLDSMPPASQAFFNDMERTGLDYIRRGSENSDQNKQWINN